MEFSYYISMQNVHIREKYFEISYKDSEYIVRPVVFEIPSRLPPDGLSNLYPLIHSCPKLWRMVSYSL